MSEELKPCPFCGGEAKDMTYGSCDCCGKLVNGSIGCNNCSSKVDHLDSTEEAITAWNTRTPSDREHKLVEALNKSYALIKDDYSICDENGWRIEAGKARHVFDSICEALSAYDTPGSQGSEKAPLPSDESLLRWAYEQIENSCPHVLTEDGHGKLLSKRLGWM